MIVLPNYLCQPGQPELCPLDVMLCHPSDYVSLKDAVSALSSVEANLVEQFNDAYRRWHEYTHGNEER